MLALGLGIGLSRPSSGGGSAFPITTPVLGDAAEPNIAGDWRPVYEIDFVDAYPTGAAIVLGSGNSPYIAGYPWSGGFGAKYADPAVVAGGIVTDVAFAPDGAAVAASHVNSPYISAWAFTTGGGFGSKFSNPGTLPGSSGYSIDFARNGAAVAAGLLSSPYVAAYAWSPSGFGSKFADPATLPAGIGYSISFGVD